MVAPEAEVMIGFPPEQSDDDEDDRDEDEEGDDEADAESEVGGRGAAGRRTGRVRGRPMSHGLRAVQHDRIEPGCKKERARFRRKPLKGPSATDRPTDRLLTLAYSV